MKKAFMLLLAFCVSGVLGCMPVLAEGNTITVEPGQSIQEAIDAAQNGDTVYVKAGTYEEAIDLKGKSISFCGPNDQIDAVKGTREPEAVLTGGVRITNAFEDNAKLEIKGFTFETKGILANTWGTGTSNLNGILIENNIMRNISDGGNGAIHFNLQEHDVVENLTVNQNRISGVTPPNNQSASGICVFAVSGVTNVTNNMIERVNHSSIQFQNGVHGTANITGNIISDWDADGVGGGRAFKLVDVDGVMNVHNNVIKRDSGVETEDADSTYCKATGVSGSSQFFLENNYWNGDGDFMSKVVIDGGAASYFPYYTDEALQHASDGVIVEAGKDYTFGENTTTDLANGTIRTGSVIRVTGTLKNAVIETTGAGAVQTGDLTMTGSVAFNENGIVDVVPGQVTVIQDAAMPDAAAFLTGVEKGEAAEVGLELTLNGSHQGQNLTNGKVKIPFDVSNISGGLTVKFGVTITGTEPGVTIDAAPYAQ